MQNANFNHYFDINFNSLYDCNKSGLVKINWYNLMLIILIFRKITYNDQL